MKPVSIAIPFFNAAPFLAGSIRSVFAQSHQDWELILIDDGSTDESLEIAKSIRDPRVKVLANSDNLRLARTLNRVTQEAKFDLIARMDADDLMIPKRIEFQVDLLSANPSIDITGTGIFSVKSNLELVGKRGSDCSHFTKKGILFGVQTLVHPAVMARKAWLKRNPYDPRMFTSEDTELWVRALAREDFNALTVSEPLLIYREEQNIAKTKMLRAYALEREFFVNCLDGYKEKCRYLARSRAKSIVVQSLHLTGNLQSLHGRRVPDSITEQDRADFKMHLEAINSTKVPGLDD